MAHDESLNLTLVNRDYPGLLAIGKRRSACTSPGLPKTVANMFPVVCPAWARTFCQFEMDGKWTR
jgi:hypothetical protein